MVSSRDGDGVDGPFSEDVFAETSAASRVNALRTTIL